jgi:hypothetical protein
MYTNSAIPGANTLPDFSTNKPFRIHKQLWGRIPCDSQEKDELQGLSGMWDGDGDLSQACSLYVYCSG